MRKCRYALALILFAALVMAVFISTSQNPQKEELPSASTANHAIQPTSLLLLGDWWHLKPAAAPAAPPPSTTSTLPTVTSTMVAPPVTPPSTVPPAAAPAPPAPAPTGDLLLADAPAYVIQAFHCIAYDHESGGNPEAVNPSSGDSGLYQFATATWNGVILRAGGEGYPSRALYASVAQQDTVAYWAWQQDGFSPWEGDNSCWE